VIGTQTVIQSDQEFPPLDLRDFFDAYDRHNPYMLSAVSRLYGEILEHAPHLLKKDSGWYQDWIWGGKRDLKTGLKLKESE
tara:strand:+ start:87 stop:329 length:243 start_codon:yes stop_codon:yes gene_type:complete